MAGMDPMRCPVCPNPHVPADQTSCSNCGADLTPLRRLQELPARLYNEALSLLHAGENDRARAKLVTAAELDPKSEPVQQLLAKIRAVPPQRASRTPAMMIAFAILALVAIGALVVALRRPPDAPVVQAAMIPIPPPAASQPAPRAFPLADLERRLSKGHDVRVDREGEGLRATFNAGLFPSGSDALTPAGRALLQSVARELAAVRVNVEGFTDSNPPPREQWKDNWALAFSRAHEAVEVLRAASGAGVTWTASSSGDLRPPHGDKEKNRTVVLHIERGTP